MIINNSLAIDGCIDEFHPCMLVNPCQFLRLLKSQNLPPESFSLDMVFGSQETPKNANGKKETRKTRGKL